MAKIEIYTTGYCPYCTRAKMLLDNKSIKYTEIPVSSDQSRIDLVKKANGQKTVPQIFIDDQHIGGYDDLYQLNAEKKLDDLIK
jgi:glutaredoxin 3